MNFTNDSLPHTACPFATCDNKTRCLLPSVHCNYVAECRDLTVSYYIH